METGLCVHLSFGWIVKCM
uniref:Uncharacterized protein n=1 Tax=Anguilla anguilla TaxID=7936 RepID=A0A0E9R2X0_ANGAN